MKLNHLRRASLSALVIPILAFLAICILGYSLKTTAFWTYVVYAVTYYFHLEHLLSSSNRRFFVNGVVFRIALAAIGSHLGLSVFAFFFVIEIVQFVYNWFYRFPNEASLSTNK